MGGYRFARALVSVWVKLVYRVEYHGRENEPLEGGYIAFGNHTSLVDPLFMACALKRSLHIVAKSDLESNKFMSWLFKWCNVVAVKRGESDMAALRKTCEVVKNGENVGIFPEGTRIPQEFPNPENALAGMGLMATRTKAPLLPVTICYGKRNKPQMFKKVHVYIGKPIMNEEYTTFDEHPNSHDIAKYAFTKLCEDFNKYNG